MVSEAIQNGRISNRAVSRLQTFVSNLEAALLFTLGWIGPLTLPIFCHFSIRQSAPSLPSVQYGTWRQFYMAIGTKSVQFVDKEISVALPPFKRVSTNCLRPKFQGRGDDIDPADPIKEARRTPGREGNADHNA